MINHQKLKISFAELGALLGVRGMLEAGILKHQSSTWPKDGRHGINMRITCKTNDECGSVGCIGGTMGLIMGKNAEDSHYYVQNARGNLRNLFFPPRSSAEYEAITAKQMLQAINNFLDTGNADWKAVLASPPKPKRVRKPRKPLAKKLAPGVRNRLNAAAKRARKKR